MSIAELKQSLHNKIDAINDEILLEEVNKAIEELHYDNNELEPNPEVINILRERRQQFIQNPENRLSLNAFQQKIKAKYGV
ncbi:hypothetical protein E3E36_11340 [Thermococcus sp. M36]|uniref:hypothetical protein n=1 Tax=Thermococcus sp. M36 TaxID=1638261 RepID=UPI00143AFDA2|nr:hypothetical protein [Thermococcus sp. M36]NJE06714.1 hypothetical protein [Thermococcus sp. M36]